MYGIACLLQNKQAIFYFLPHHSPQHYGTNLAFPFSDVLQLRKYGYKADFLFYNRITFPDCTSET